MKNKCFRLAILCALVVFGLVMTATAQRASQPSAAAIPNSILLKIVRYEDQRNWNDGLKSLLSDKDANVRKRAALAAGRIGDERAVPALADMLLTDRDTDVRQMAAFALGEIESPGGAYALTEVLKRRGNDLADGVVRARAIEALGKIVAAMVAAAPAGEGPAKAPEDDRLDIMRAAIVDALRFEDSRRAQSDRLTILLGLTAVLRIKPDGVGPLVTRFLDYSDPEIVATALNTMARLRLKDGNEQVRKLLNHSDPIVRANAARVIGAAEHKEAFDAVLDRALHDQDLRVRASAIRALGSLKLPNAANPLLTRAQHLAFAYQQLLWRTVPHATEINEMLEISTALGSILANTANNSVITFLHELRKREDFSDPELEIAYARIAPAQYLIDQNLALFVRPTQDERKAIGWRTFSSIARGFATLAPIKEAADGSAGDSAQHDAQRQLRVILANKRVPPLAIPDLLQALAALKANDQGALRTRLTDADVIIRATAAQLLGNESADQANTRVLADALILELPRVEKGGMNDAALAILDALAKQKNAAANDAIKTALNSGDHLIRRKAVALLKTNGVGDFSDRIGLVKTRYTDADYRRATARIGRKVTATVVTSKGAFTIELLPDEASLTVDNFIQLARKGFFNGQTIPRVVPNFVVQAGDPRGDQNGGPGYQIRCEINEVSYERAAVGMALSGKDTGGSQWFVTHSPQPHLDGGYTVFGRVIRGMDVVDKIARGDVIRRVIISEG